jgi:predicted transcriptional regulator
MSDITITAEQIRLMKHSIGFEPCKVKRMIYKAYRNYFCAGEEMKEFEDLIAKELAVKSIRQKQVYYFLTDKGMAFISEITGVKIRETD